MCQPSTFWPLQGTFHAMASIVRGSGIRGLFKGWGPTVLANAPFSAVYYSFYTNIRTRLEAVSMWPRQAEAFGLLACVPSQADSSIWPAGLHASPVVT